MLTNKDYDRLTLQPDRRRGMICGIGLKANSEEIADRLCSLEDKIENGTLVFLPCRVGDIFWRIDWFNPPESIEEVVVDGIEFMRDDCIRIRVHSLHQQFETYFCPEAIGEDLFTSKKAAEKVLEKLKKCTTKNTK